MAGILHPRRERPYGDLVYAFMQRGTPRYTVIVHPDDLPGHEIDAGNPKGAVAALRVAARKFAGTRCAYGVRCANAASMQISVDGTVIDGVTIDHVVARNGSRDQHALSNLVVACDACNSHKGRTPVAEWLLDHGRKQDATTPRGRSPTTIG